MSTVLESINDNESISEMQQVKYKHEGINCLNIFLIALGSFFMLLSIIDMTVFYVIPNNKIKSNKAKYPNFTFEKPKKAIIVLHFLEHASLFLVGVVIIFAIFPRIKKSIAYITISVVLATLTALFYIIYLVLCAFVYDSIPKDDINIDSITNSINNDRPIESIFVYLYGNIHRSKSANQKCYSKTGINIPVDSTLLSDYFDPLNNPGFFILKVEQNATIDENLKEVLSQAKKILYSCDSRYSFVEDYYPLVDIDNLIRNGQERPKQLKKNSMLASIILGVGVYTELYYKSLPIVKYSQNSDVKQVQGFDYNQALSSVQCSSIGKCEVGNKKPHP